MNNMLILWTMTRKFPTEGKGYLKCHKVVSEIAEASNVFIRHGGAIGEKTVIPKLVNDIENVFEEQVFKPKYKGGYDPLAPLLRNTVMCKTEPIPDLCLAWFVGKRSGGALHTVNQAKKYNIHVLEYIV